MRSVIALFLILFPAASSALFAQSIYLEKGESGYSIGAAAQAEKDFFSFSTFAGYSFSGTVDAGFSLGGGFMEPDTDRLKKSITFYSLSPYASLIVLRESKTVPVNLTVHLSCYYRNYSSREMDDEEIKMSETGASAGVEISKKIAVKESSSFMPGIELSYNIRNVTTRTKPDPEKSSDSGFFGLEAFFAFCFDNGDDTKVVLKPSAGISDGKAKGGISFSAVYH